MRYIDVKWLHENADEPVRLVSEIGVDGYETGKLQFFRDGHCGFACASEASPGVELGSAPVPPLDEINADAEFEGVEISLANFEALWLEIIR
jgi:hypothetical protein